MSATAESDVTQTPRKIPRPLTRAQREAIIAACAAGAHKGNLANEFGIRRESISRILREAKSVQSSANPLSTDYKAGLRNNAVEAIHRGLDAKKDPYRAADIGVRVMQGIGEFATGSQVQVNVANVLTSCPVEFDSDMAITPEDAIDVEPE